jgi:prepilin-type N-terminal cleavage/methylation domain-containing protein
MPGTRNPFIGARRRGGFSLTEVLLVLSLLGVVTAVALPTVSRSLTSVRADRAAAIVAADVKLAFSLAARQNRPVRLTLVAAQRQFLITDRASGTVLQRRNFGTGAADLMVSSLAGTVTNVDVFPNGLASTAVTYTLRVGDHQRAIVASRTGHVRVN